MFLRATRLLPAGVVVCGVLSACASAPPHPAIGRSVEDIYNQVQHHGARDTVALVRQGLRANGAYGTSDPTIPVRTPETVVPIWVPAYVDKDSGDRVAGHWQDAVIRKSQWQLGY